MKANFSILALAFLCLVALISTGCDDLTSNATDRRCAIDNATAKAQADASRAASLVALETQKRITALQLDVSKRCADRGMIPIYLGQNVDCKPAK